MNLDLELLRILYKLFFFSLYPHILFWNLTKVNTDYLTIFGWKWKMLIIILQRTGNKGMTFFYFLLRIIFHCFFFLNFKHKSVICLVRYYQVKVVPSTLNSHLSTKCTGHFDRYLSILIPDMQGTLYFLFFYFLFISFFFLSLSLSLYIFQLYRHNLLRQPLFHLLLFYCFLLL